MPAVPTIVVLVKFRLSDAAVLEVVISLFALMLIGFATGLAVFDRSTVVFNFPPARNNVPAPLPNVASPSILTAPALSVVLPT